MTCASAFVDEVANELATWPGVRIERRENGAVAVRCERSEPAGVGPESYGVSQNRQGPTDLTAALELFDRRYRDVRGEEDPYSSEGPA